MSMHRIRAGAALALSAIALSALSASSASTAAVAEAPRTGFEQRNGASWTTHEEELAFLKAVDEASDRVVVEQIGKTLRGRPLHLVRLGHPTPRPQGVVVGEPTLMFACSQHGNEPAGRETCLKTLRDLAFTKDPELVSLLSSSTVLFVPSANPDGRAANSRGNSQGVDINRDHLNLETLEAQAIGKVVRDWKPDISLDLHEYGPSLPALYDDDVLTLWPRNLNVDRQVYTLSKSLALDYIQPGAEAHGYSADEYGLYSLAENDIHQAAGDQDEGSMRNAMGLRHAVGILVESAVSANPVQNGHEEAVDEPTLNRRRVASQMQVSLDTLRFLAEQGDLTKFATDRAPIRKAREGANRSAPVYFGGADNDPPSASEMVNPPPCAYELTAAQAAKVKDAFAIHGISSTPRESALLVSMGQAAEPVIPLLLDDRGSRNSVAGKALAAC